MAGMFSFSFKVQWPYARPAPFLACVAWHRNQVMAVEFVRHCFSSLVSVFVISFSLMWSICKINA